MCTLIKKLWKLSTKHSTNSKHSDNAPIIRGYHTKDHNIFVAFLFQEKNTTFLIGAVIIEDCYLWMNVNSYSLFYDLVAFYIVYNISRTDIKDLAASFINTKQTERHFIQYFTRYLIFFYWNWTFEIVSGKSFYDIQYEQILLDQYNYFSFTFIPRQVILNETSCTRLIFW